MDKAPLPGQPEQFETPESIRRKKRLVNRLRLFLKGEDSEGVHEVDLSSQESDNDESEFWSRDEEDAEMPREGFVSKVQRLGRRVLEQTWSVHEFAESVGEKVEDLPLESKAQIKPETERLQTATGELRDAAEELNEELQETPEESLPVPDKSTGNETVVAPVKAEAIKPKKDFSEGLNMAKLVIATLIGGGLGALMVGESKNAKESNEKSKPKAQEVIAIQQDKIEAQEAELQQLKAAKPEVVSQKDYVKKAAELAERQTELTQSTVEQVRTATKQATEQETAFKIPENKAETIPINLEKLKDTVDKTERLEHYSEQTFEQKEQAKGAQQTQETLRPIQPAQKSPYEQHWRQMAHLQPQKQGQMVPKVTLYWVLLAAAVVVAIGVLLIPR